MAKQVTLPNHYQQVEKIHSSSLVEGTPKLHGKEGGYLML